MMGHTDATSAASESGRGHARDHVRVPRLLRAPAGLRNHEWSRSRLSQIGWWYG